MVNLELLQIQYIDFQMHKRFWCFSLIGMWGDRSGKYKDGMRIVSVPKY